jgi:DNA-binding NarL/FixJ family response regulator
MNNIKIGLFDDHPMTAKGVADYLVSNQIDIAFTASNKIDLFIYLQENIIDILILDIVAPDVAGLELFEQIAVSHPDVIQIAYSTLNSPMLVENLLILGVKGFVNKKQEAADLLECILKVQEGDISIPEDFTFLTSRYHHLSSSILTPREIEILILISKELTSSDIATNLSLSIYTVENHRKNIFKKLDVKNLAGLIITASRLGYIS